MVIKHGRHFIHLTGFSSSRRPPTYRLRMIDIEAMVDKTNEHGIATEVLLTSGQSYLVNHPAGDIEAILDEVLTTQGNSFKRLLAREDKVVIESEERLTY